MPIRAEPWCVLLTSRENVTVPALAAREPRAPQEFPAVGRDPLTDTLRRAATVSPRDKIVAVTASPCEAMRLSALKALAPANIFHQPKHQGTAFEVLLGLLRLEERVPPSEPIVFLPADHLVNNEEVMTSSLLDMAEWIAVEPRPVYLLGTVPEGPHDELGYIVPWHDAMQMPTSVYEFVEKPDVSEARKLINSGGLWNTFIFGGTLRSMIELFVPRFDAILNAMRAALKERPVEPLLGPLAAIYERLAPVDFSQDVLASQADSLNVLRMPRCGWWPLKSPKGNRRFADVD